MAPAVPSTHAVPTGRRPWVSARRPPNPQRPDRPGPAALGDLLYGDDDARGAGRSDEHARCHLAQGQPRHRRRGRSQLVAYSGSRCGPQHNGSSAAQVGDDQERNRGYGRKSDCREDGPLAQKTCMQLAGRVGKGHRQCAGHVPLYSGERRQHGHDERWAPANRPGRAPPRHRAGPGKPPEHALGGSSSRCVLPAHRALSRLRSAGRSRHRQRSLGPVGRPRPTRLCRAPVPRPQAHRPLLVYRPGCAQTGRR